MQEWHGKRNERNNCRYFREQVGGHCELEILQQHAVVDGQELASIWR